MAISELQRYVFTSSQFVWHYPFDVLHREQTVWIEDAKIQRCSNVTSVPEVLKNTHFWN